MEDYLNPHHIYPNRIDPASGFDSIRPGQKRDTAQGAPFDEFGMQLSEEAVTEDAQQANEGDTPTNKALEDKSALTPLEVGK